MRNPFFAMILGPLWIDCLVDPLLQSIEHRPWPLPSGSWLIKQIWHDLLFAHWPVPKLQCDLSSPHNSRWTPSMANAGLESLPFA